MRVGDRAARGATDLHQYRRAPDVPRSPGLAEVDYLTSTGMMDVDFLPEHLIVLGGSYIGLEFAQMYRRFGSRVTVVEMAPRLIAREDEEVSLARAGDSGAEGIAVRLNAECVRVEKRGGGVVVHVSCEEEPREIVGSHLLLAVGRVPNTDDLGLDRAGVATDARGFIEVDDATATNVPGSGRSATSMGAARSRIPRTTTTRSSPPTCSTTTPRRVSDRFPVYALFTDPPLARAGMTEREARASGRPVLVGRRAMTRVGRARERGETQGFMQVLVDGGDEEDPRRGAARHRSGRGDSLHHRRDVRRRSVHGDPPRGAHPPDGLGTDSHAVGRVATALDLTNRADCMGRGDNTRRSCE